MLQVKHLPLFASLATSFMKLPRPSSFQTSIRIWIPSPSSASVSIASTCDMCLLNSTEPTCNCMRCLKCLRGRARAAVRPSAAVRRGPARQCQCTLQRADRELPN